MEARDFEVRPEPEVLDEIRTSGKNIEGTIEEAIGMLNEPDADDLSVARAYQERGYSEDFAYWLVREANVRRAPGKPLV